MSWWSSVVLSGGNSPRAGKQGSIWAPNTNEQAGRVWVVSWPRAPTVSLTEWHHRLLGGPVWTQREWRLRTLVGRIRRGRNGSP
jgi:hypothetical protein